MGWPTNFERPPRLSPLLKHTRVTALRRLHCSQWSAVPVPVPVNEPATVIFRAIVRDENRNQVLHSGEAIAIEIEVKNEGPGTAQAVELSVTATLPLIEQMPSVISVGDLQPGEVKQMTLDGKIGMVKDAMQEELTLMLCAGSPVGPAAVRQEVSGGDEAWGSHRSCGSAGRCRPATQAVQETQTAEGYRHRHRRGTVSGEQHRQGQVCARDAETMATYLKSIGGIPSERIRTLVDTHALKSDLAEVFDQWLPERVDPTTVVYVSVTGRGVVEPATGTVSMLLFDSTATSTARLYSLRRLQESLMRLPIHRAIVMLDLSLELAPGKEAPVGVIPVWDRESSGKRRSCG